MKTLDYINETLDKHFYYYFFFISFFIQVQKTHKNIILYLVWVLA